MKRIVALMFIILCGNMGELSAQHEAADHDSTYIHVNRVFIMGRFLMTRKRTGLNVTNDLNDYSIRYRPNKAFSIGLGVTYKFLSLNFSVGLIEPSEKGETRNIDLQLHRYGRKYVTDLLLQFYKGFYIPDGRFAPLGEAFYVRPDLAVSAMGLSHQYIFNNRRFSYRAAFQQTEIQKRSAGSFTAGVELYYGRFRADSTVIPAQLTPSTREKISRMNFIEGGPGIGYIYTWVYRKLYFTAGGSISLNMGVYKLFTDEEKRAYTKVSPNSVFRLAAGYNAGRWSTNLLYLSRALQLPDLGNSSVLFSARNLRLNIVYRFTPGRNTKKLLKGIDKVDRKLNE